MKPYYSVRIPSVEPLRRTQWHPTERTVIKERVVWSARCGGCLMVQRFVDGTWVDQFSQDEGEHPEFNDAARAAVEFANAYRRADALCWKAAKLEKRAAVLRFKAQQACERAGMTGNYGDLHATRI